MTTHRQLLRVRRLLKQWSRMKTFNMRGFSHANYTKKNILLKSAETQAWVLVTQFRRDSVEKDGVRAAQAIAEVRKYANQFSDNYCQSVVQSMDVASNALSLDNS